MRLSWFEPRKCYRLQVPARYAEDGKRRAVYFATPAEGNKYIACLINRPGSNHSVRMPMSDQVFLEELRTLLGSNDGIRQAVEFYAKTVLAVKHHGTVFEMVAAYRSWQAGMSRTPAGLDSIKFWANKFEAKFGNEKPTELTYSGLSAWINSFPGGKGHAARRNAYTFAHALLNWAQKNGWIGQDILKGLEKPERNILKNVMAIGDFERVLRACAGLDPKVTEDFSAILPVLVLQGLAGIRTCELIGKCSIQSDVLQWGDINWAKGWVTIRDEVAKKTSRKAGDQRYPILTPAAVAWLKLVAKTSGPIFSGNQAKFTKLKNQMLKSVGIKMAQNTLRHSYATYGVSCGSLADIAKNMGDLESTVRAKYVDPNIEPRTGEAWFSLRPDVPAKVVSMGVAA